MRKALFSLIVACMLTGCSKKELVEVEETTEVVTTTETTTEELTEEITEETTEEITEEPVEDITTEEIPHIEVKKESKILQPKETVKSVKSKEVKPKEEKVVEEVKVEPVVETKAEGKTKYIWCDESYTWEKKWVVDEPAHTEELPIYEEIKCAICNQCDKLLYTNEEVTTHLMESDTCGGYSSYVIEKVVGTKTVCHAEKGHWEEYKKSNNDAFWCKESEIDNVEPSRRNMNKVKYE